MATWQGKSRGTVLGYRIFFWTLRTFGVKGAYLLLRFVTFYYFLFAGKAVRAQMQYFEQVHGWKGFKARRAAYKNLVQFGQTLIDKAVVMSGAIEVPFDIIRDGEEHIANALDAGKGLLLISAHVGNWEVAGHMLNKFDTPVNLVMMDAEREQLKKYLENIMAQRALNIIPIGDDLSHLVAIKQAFNRKEIVALHGDRFVEGQRTHTTEFFGKPAQFPLGPFILAEKMRVPVLYVFCMKRDSLTYHFYAHTTETAQTAAEYAALFNRLLEQKVRAYPHQWYNYYDFWALKEANNDGNHAGR